MRVLLPTSATALALAGCSIDNVAAYLDTAGLACAGATTYFIDYDGDGFGSDAYTMDACTLPEGWSATADDCADTDSAVNPAAPELCNDVDDDCDGAIDEDDAADARTWFIDADGDGHGLSSATTRACAQPRGYAPADDDCDDQDATTFPGALEMCDGRDTDCDGHADNGALGGDRECAAASCRAILDDGSARGDGQYWIDPDEDGDLRDAWPAFCDMTEDGGGWTRVYASLWPYWWDPGDWEDKGGPEDDVMSRLGERIDLAEAGTRYTFRLEVGNRGTWNSFERAHFTTWRQDHDPFYDSTDGSDYTFIDGEEPSTCGGFNGLHEEYWLDSGVHARTSDVDTTDAVECWWMQIVPLSQYETPEQYPGYLEGYNGPNTHTWQVLWMR